MISNTDRSGAVDNVKVRTPKALHGKDLSEVIVGGNIIGYTQKHPFAKSWARYRILDQDHKQINDETGRTVKFATRTEAAEALARFDLGAQSYRESARKGGYGTAEERRVREEDAELERDGAYEDAFGDGFDQSTLDEFAFGGFTPPARSELAQVEQTLVIPTAEARAGDRVVNIEGEDLGQDGPVVLAAARPIYGDSGPWGVRITGPRTHAIFLDVEAIETITVSRIVTED